EAQRHDGTRCDDTYYAYGGEKPFHHSTLLVKKSNRWQHPPCACAERPLTHGGRYVPNACLCRKPLVASTSCWVFHLQSPLSKSSLPLPHQPQTREHSPIGSPATSVPPPLQPNS